MAPFDPRGTDVAVVLDLMIHDIDIIMSLIKSPIQKIDASGVAVVSNQIDIANARLQFENGCVANLTASRISAKKMRKMRVFQKDAYISIDFLERKSEVFSLISDGQNVENSAKMLGQIEQGDKKRNIVHQQLESQAINAMEEEWKDFIRCIDSGAEPIVSGHDGLNALKIASKVSEIISQNRID